PDGVENARVLALPRDALLRALSSAEHALEEDAGIQLHRQRGRLRRPRNGVEVRAAVAHLARADRAAEVLGRELERRERGLLSDLPREHLVERGARVDVA